MRPKSIFLFLCTLVAGGCNAGALRRDSGAIPELQYINESIDPCEDFYEFTCGNFKNIHPLPQGRSIWDHFAILQEEIHAVAKEILNSPREHREPVALQKAKAFYTGCLDVHAMEYLNNGYSVQVDFINKLHKWPAITFNYDDAEKKLSWIELAELTAQYGLSFLFSFSVEPSLSDATANTIYIQRDTLENPEASNIRPELPVDFTRYLEDIPDGSSTQQAKANHYFEFLKSIAFRMRDISGERYTPDSQVIDQLEETIRYMLQVSENGIQNNSTLPEVSINELTVEELQIWTDDQFGAGFIDWVQYLNKVINRADVEITSTTRVLHFGGGMIYGLMNLYRLSTPRQLKNYVIARLLTHMAPDGDKFMRDEWRKFMNNSGYVIYPRDDYCVRKTLGYSGNVDFSLAVTSEYQKYHFDMNKLDKADTLINDIYNTFMEILDNSEWMDEESTAMAKDKAMKMVTLLGYPEQVVEEESELNEYYDDMKVCTWDHFGNAQRLRAFQFGQNMHAIGDKKKRDLWSLSPLEVNAFYNRGHNRVFLPISILNNVFFSGKSNVLDYARMGSIIGHEITHGFDKAGKMYNAEGVMFDIPLWTNSTSTAFLEREVCFAEQYSKYYIDEINAYVDGSKTLNENLADNGGLSTAYKAYLKLKAAARLDLTSGTNYTPEQLFFIGFGTMWCTQETNEYTALMNKNGSYPPGRYRVIGAVSNMPEFADAFQCPKGAPMNPEEKCKMW